MNLLWNDHEKDMFITINYLLIKNYGFSENIFEIKRYIFYIIVFKLLWLISFTITVINILNINSMKFHKIFCMRKTSTGFIVIIYFRD